MNHAVFIERDGVLNLLRNNGHQPATPESLKDFKINPAATAVVEQLKAEGFLVFATTNQPGLTRGTLARRELDAMHDLLRQAMPLDEILVCPHDSDDDCPCRKPRPGLLLEAAFKWHIDLGGSFVISDKWQDARAADAANCTSLLVKSPWNGDCHHDMIRENLSDVFQAILQVASARKARLGPI